MQMNTVLIGDKELSRYITACLTAIQRDKYVKIAARGRFIKKAVDIEEIVKRYLKKPEVNVKLDSVSFDNRQVSVIEIEIKETA